MLSGWFVLFSILILTITVTAQPQQQPAPTAARIIVIKPKEGMQQQFDEGYKRHLDWHRQNKDPWTWYGWQIISGERLGYFMDGTFGHAWENFDRAVAPAADNADNVKNVAPFGEFRSVSHYVLMPEISRSRLLEEGTPSPVVELLYYHIYPGKEREFETLLLKAHAAYDKTRQSSGRYTWYKLVSGGSHPLYLLMLPLNKPSELQLTEKSFMRILEDAYPQKESAPLLESLRAAVRELRSETLIYRADMSYFPPKN